MASKLRIPRGIYLSWRARADHTIVFRWGMAPGLRKRGIKAIDLVDAAGRPLEIKAAIARATELTAALKANTPLPATPVRQIAGSRTIGDLVDAFLAPANLNAMRTKKTGGLLAEDSKRSYKYWAVAIRDVFQDQPVGHLNDELVTAWYAVTRETRGHHMASHACGLLKAIWKWAGDDWGLAPVKWDRVIAPEPPAKLRVGHPDELACLLMAMDDPEQLYARLAAEGRAVNGPHIPARPELGDSLVLAVWTTQRVKDDLAITADAVAGGRLRWIASKNMEGKGRRGLDMPLMGPLPARIEQIRERRKANGITCPTLITAPGKDRPYSQQMHGKHFREARALAALFYPSLLGEGLDPWGRQVPAFTFEDCRDTGITRLHDAGCDLLQICSWSNHANVKSLMALIASYIDISGRTADRAGEKMQAMWDANKWAV